MASLFSSVKGLAHKVGDALSGHAAHSEQSQSPPETWSVTQDAASCKFIVALPPAGDLASALGGLGLGGVGTQAQPPAAASGATQAYLSYRLLGATAPCDASSALAAITTGATCQQIERECPQSPNRGRRKLAPALTALAPQPAPTVTTIFVPEAFRHRGVGAALALALLGWAQKQSICDVLMPDPAVRSFVGCHMAAMQSRGYDLVLTSRKAAAGAAPTPTATCAAGGAAPSAAKAAAC